MELVWLAGARAASVVGETVNPVCVKTWPSIVETTV